MSFFRDLSGFIHYEYSKFTSWLMYKIWGKNHFTDLRIVYRNN